MPHPNTPFDPSTPLRHLLRLAIPICRRGERDLPPRARSPCRDPRVGRRRDDPRGDRQAAQDQVGPVPLPRAHADALVARLGLPRFPARSTYFQRYRTASVLMVAAAAAHTDHAARGAASTSAASPPIRP